MRAVRLMFVPLVGDNDVLATREFVLASAQRLNDVLQVGLLGADREDDLTDVDTGDEASGLSERLSEQRGKHTEERSVSGARDEFTSDELIRFDWLVSPSELVVCCVSDLIPVWRRSAPAQLNILLMRSTWKGCRRTRKWNESLPAILVMYLFTTMRPASRASEDSCSYSPEHK